MDQKVGESSVHTGAIPKDHEIRLNGTTMVCGTAEFIWDFYCHLTGGYFEPSYDKYDEEAHKNYLRQISEEYNIDFEGASIELAPIGGKVVVGCTFLASLNL